MTFSQDITPQSLVAGLNAGTSIIVALSSMQSPISTLAYYPASQNTTHLPFPCAGYPAKRDPCHSTIGASVPDTQHSSRVVLWHPVRA